MPHECGFLPPRRDASHLSYTAAIRKAWYEDGDFTIKTLLPG